MTAILSPTSVDFMQSGGDVLVSAAPTPERSMFWHRMGSNLTDVTDYNEALRRAGLDWELRLIPAENMAVAHEDGTVNTSIPRKKLLIRTDNNVTLNTVGMRYSAVSNREAFVPCIGLQNNGARYVSGGSIDYGRVCYMLLQPLSGEVTITTPHGTDTIRMDLFIRAGHGGYGKVTYEVRATHVQNATSTTVSLRNFPGLDPVIAVRHTPKVKDRLRDAEKMLNQHARYMAGFVSIAQDLANTNLSVAQFATLLDEMNVPPKPRKATQALDNGEVLSKKAEADLASYEQRRAELITSFKNDPIATNTAYGAFLILSRWHEWKRGVRTSSERSTELAVAQRAFKDESRRFRSVLMTKLMQY